MKITNPATWVKFDGDLPPVGLYLAMYSQDGQPVLELLEVDEYAGGMGWYEVVSDDWDEEALPRDVICYVPENIDYMSVVSVRSKFTGEQV